jgi:hypothetical protein
MGETFDEGKLTSLRPGIFGVIPISMRHLAASTKPT